MRATREGDRRVVTAVGEGRAAVAEHPQADQIVRIPEVAGRHLHAVAIGERLRRSPNVPAPFGPLRIEPSLSAAFGADVSATQRTPGLALPSVAHCQSVALCGTSEAFDTRNANPTLEFAPCCAAPYPYIVAASTAARRAAIEHGCARRGARLLAQPSVGARSSHRVAARIDRIRARVRRRWEACGGDAEGHARSGQTERGTDDGARLGHRTRGAA